MKLKMVKEMKNEGRTYQLYTLGKYEVDVTTFESGYASIKVSKDWKEEYLPEIYERNNGFAIQTTSYGSLQTEELKKVIAGYEYAMEAVEILNREFSNK